MLQGGAVVQDIAHLGDQPVLGEHRCEHDTGGRVDGLSMEGHYAHVVDRHPSAFDDIVQRGLVGQVTVRLGDYLGIRPSEMNTAGKASLAVSMTLP